MNTQEGSRDSIEELFRRYSDDVFRYARMTLGDQADARDVVQEVFFRAFRAWSGFKQESNAKTWLLSIARNYMVDLMRKRQRERQLLHAYEPPDMDMESDSVPVETMMALEAALQQLKPMYREAFVLRYIEQLSIRDTAQTLGWSEGKVRTTASRAVHMLREILRVDESGVIRYDV